MHLLHQYIDFILHLNTHLSALVAVYGDWIYGIVFLIIFCETGLIITPFLPGESLLFALGTIAATGALSVNSLVVLLIIAAILGGFVNYILGLTVGKKIAMSSHPTSMVNRYIQRAHSFYQKYGAFTIVIARLIPIIRTYAPFVAGIARMNFLVYGLFNILGAIAWISFFLYVSYFFGNIPVVKQHFSIIILGIIFISVVPVAVEFLREVTKKNKKR